MIKETEEADKPIIKEEDKKLKKLKKKQENDGEKSKSRKRKDRDDEYTVERIEDMRIKKGNREFLVAWKGYGKEDMTWEPEDNLTHAKELKNEFFDRNKLLCRECGYQARSQSGMRSHTRKNHKES